MTVYDFPTRQPEPVVPLSDGSLIPTPLGTLLAAIDLAGQASAIHEPGDDLDPHPIAAALLIAISVDAGPVAATAAYQRVARWAGPQWARVLDQVVPVP